MSKKPKKVNRRNTVKFPGLEPKYNLKSRQEEIEDIASYAHKLGPKEKAWLNSYVEEEINANFQHGGKKINKTKKAQREIYNKNNARNRDVFTRAKAQNKLDSLSDLSWWDDWIDKKED